LQAMWLESHYQVCGVGVFHLFVLYPFRRRKSCAAAHSVQSTSIACVKSTPCRERFGTANRRHTVSRSALDRCCENGTCR
jgi:hypothetical protein